MSFDPQKPSKARAETRLVVSSAAGSSPPHPHHSPAEEFATSAAPQPATGDDAAVAGQQFRSVRPIPAFVLDSILDRSPNLYERFAANDRAYREAERRAEGGIVGWAILFAVAVVIAVLLATGGVK